jgi:phosphopantothenoylcysteine decarboxylase/phosphopantothenate--cysteine ligase
VGSTEELATAMATEAAAADIVVMAAAPADFTPVNPSTTKLKKTGDAGLTVEFRQTTDVLAGLVATRSPGQVIIGFAAETASDEAELIELGTAKLARKGCQLLVLNDVSGGAVFGAADNQVLVLGSNGVLSSAAGTKTTVAHAIWDAAITVKEGKTA